MSFVDIEKALVKIDEVASNQEGIAVEEALILRGLVVMFPIIFLVDPLPAPSPVNWMYTKIRWSV
jgi:hypothetical protein